MLIAINAEKQTIYDAQAMVRHIRSNSYAPIVVIAPSKNEEALLEDGADSCFPPTISDGPLLAHTMAIIRRYALYDSGRNLYDRDMLTLRRGDLLIERQKHRVTQSGKVKELTRREYRLLIQFACSICILRSRAVAGAVANGRSAVVNGRREISRSTRA